MSLLSYRAILQLINAGVIENSKHEHVNAASLDLTLGKFILAEKLADNGTHYKANRVSLATRTPLHTEKYDLEKEGTFILQPGQFILAQTREVFNLPNYLSAEYKLKSSMARIGLEHLNAGWCDAGWHGSVLTLEFRNMTTFHEIELKFGDKIGQMIFFEHEDVPEEASYATKGSYNKHTEVSSAVAIQAVEDVIIHHKSIHPEPELEGESK